MFQEASISNHQRMINKLHRIRWLKNQTKVKYCEKIFPLGAGDKGIHQYERENGLKGRILIRLQAVRAVPEVAG